MKKKIIMIVLRGYEYSPYCSFYSWFSLTQLCKHVSEQSNMTKTISCASSIITIALKQMTFVNLLCFLRIIIAYFNFHFKRVSSFRPFFWFTRHNIKMAANKGYRSSLCYPPRWYVSQNKITSFLFLVVHELFGNNDAAIFHQVLIKCFQY